MTRYNARDIIEKFMVWFKNNSEIYEALEMAIKALEQNESAEEWYKLFVKKLDEQEPTDAISLPTVVKFEGTNMACMGGDEIMKEFENNIQQNNDKVISLERAKKQIGRWIGYIDQDMINRICMSLDALPPVTQKSGEWIKVKSGDKDFPESIVCSKCGRENSHLDFNENAEPIGKVFVTSKFCPNCGCRMLFNRSTENHELNKNLDKEEGEKHE